MEPKDTVESEVIIDINILAGTVAEFGEELRTIKVIIY